MPASGTAGPWEYSGPAIINRNGGTFMIMGIKNIKGTKGTKKGNRARSGQIDGNRWWSEG